MAAAIPTTVPSTVRAGDTLKFSLALPDYPASDGWTARLRLSSALTDLQGFASVADGADHLFTIAAATTALWPVDVFGYAVYVDGVASEEYTVESGEIQVLTDLRTAGAADLRSHARKVLEQIEARLEGRLLKDQLSYSIEGRSLTLMNPEQLIMLHKRYTALVAAEVRRDKLAKGLGNPAKIQVRFTKG